MAKLIYGLVKEGKGHEYHEKVLDTYILVIGKENMFIGNTALKGKVLNNTKLTPQDLFEIDVEPRIKQTGEIVPGNKMHWKFFELPKFKISEEYNKIKEYDAVLDDSNKLYQEKIEWLNNNLKEQWLEFLIECSNQSTIPVRNKLITKGYDIMKLATWSPTDRVLLWKQKQSEIDAQQQKLFDKEEAFQEGKLEGIKEGELKGKWKGEIKQIRSLLKYGVKPEKIKEELKILNHGKNEEKFDFNLEYINKHPEDTESQIIGGLDIEMTDL